MPEGTYYEIINPSDKAFFFAPSLTIATLVTVILGNGQYAAKPEAEDAPEVPMFLFGGFDEWWTENFEEDLEGAVDRHRGEIAKSLRSVAYGDMQTRRLFDAALEAIEDPEKRATFIAKWNDEKRTSLNDIMGRAHQIAQNMEAAEAEAEGKQ